jgi:hypothetical protein
MNKTLKDRLVKELRLEGVDYSVFDKARQVKQADIVSNIRLGAVLKHVQEQQQRQVVERSNGSEVTWSVEDRRGTLPRDQSRSFVSGPVTD